MITPQQKQAWREEYLEEMRNVSRERLDLNESQVLDKTVIADRLFLFLIETIVPYINTLGYYLQNNPLDDEDSGEEQFQIPEDVILTRSELFEYLSGMSQYGRDIVLSKLSNYEILLSAVQNNDEEQFLNATDENDTVLAQICLEVGLANKMLLMLRDFFSFLAEAFAYLMSEEAVNDSDSSSTKDDFVDSMDEYLEKQAQDFSFFTHGKEQDLINTIFEQLPTILPLVSSLKLDEEAAYVYTMACSSFYLFTRIFSTLDSEERVILAEAIKETEYPDVLEDTKQVLYLLYNFSGNGMYELCNMDELDRKRETLPNEVIAKIEDPFQSLMALFSTKSNPQSN